MATTLKQYIEASHIPAEIIRAVVRQSGGWNRFKEIAQDVASYGADAGFSGFIYYADTVAFYKKHRKSINAFADSMAKDLGENVLDMVAGFNCLDTNAGEVAECMFDSRTKNDYATSIHNALAWFALEEVSRSYYDMVESF